MRIIDIEIKNYKSCEQTNLEIGCSLTTLIGINGSGKTNILSAIKLLKMITYERNYYHYKFNNSLNSLFKTVLIASFEEKDEIIDLKATFYYDIGSDTEEEIAFIETGWRMHDQNSRKWIEIPYELINRNIYKDMENLFIRSRAFNDPQIQNIIKLKNSLPSSFIDLFSKVMEYISKISYYSATQFSNPQRCPTSVEFEERENKSIYRQSRNYGPHKNFIFDIIKLKRESIDKYKRYINLIGPKGISLIDNIVFEEVNFSSEEVNVKSGGKVVTQKQKKSIIVPKIYLGKNILSFNQLSEGTFKTIALLFYLIKDDKSLLLVEEPEVCVHHGLLKNVIEIIKRESQNKQIIISTHSDFVLDHMQPEDLVIITKNENEGTKAKRLTKSMKKNDYKALHEYLDNVGNLGEYWKEGGLDA